MSDLHSIHPNQPDVAPNFVDVPEAGPTAVLPPTPEEHPPGPKPTGTIHRDGECLPNLPDVQPEVIARDQEPPPDAPPPPVEPQSGVAVPGWLRWGYFAATLFLAAVFGLFLFSQAISSLALASTLPVWAQYLLLIPLALCCLVVFGFSCSLVYSWLRLRAVRQISLEAVEELRRRAESRRDGIEHVQEARRTLQHYMEGYPLTGRGAGRLVGAGLSEEDVESLDRERGRLTALTTDSASWLDEFRRYFQSRLDQAAAKRVTSWSLKAAGCVMASPVPFLDAILILGIALKMIRDLCVLYNVRTGGTASLVLLTRAIRNAFIAGVAEDAADAATGFLGEEMAGLFGQSALGAASSSLTRMIAPKLGEGAINGLFMRRLGRATIRMLKPLRD